MGAHHQGRFRHCTLLRKKHDDRTVRDGQLSSLIKVVLVVAVAVASASGSALADDKKDELTVLPWTDASLVLSSADKRASVSYAQTFEQGIGLVLKVSAPRPCTFLASRLE